MGVWFPDGWMESAPAGFPLPPLIPPGPLSLLAAEREGGREWRLGGGPPLPRILFSALSLPCEMIKYFTGPAFALPEGTR
jgi:hypothetical protein